MSALARWCFRHRLSVVGIWVAVLAVLGLLTSTIGSDYKNDFSLSGTDSQRATELLEEAVPEASGSSDQIVLQVDEGTVNDADTQERVAGMLDEVAGLDSVASVTSPYSEEGATQISEDGKTAYATVVFDDQANLLEREDIQAVVDTAQGIDGDGLQVELGGQAIERLSMSETSYTELVGIGAAAIILFIAFGSLLGMLTPILVALVGLGAGILSIGLLTQLITMGDIAPTLAALIGLGVGIDYALFIVTRFRTGLQAGLEPEDSAARALDTSGRAVLFAGGTVIVALLGLLVLDVSFLVGMAVGSAVTVAFTVLVAITLLPAILGFFGMKMLSRKQRAALAEHGPQQGELSRTWARWADWITQHKGVMSILAIGLVVVMSIPTLSLRLGSSDAGNDPEDSTTRQAYDLLADGFGPGFNGPLTVVADVSGEDGTQAYDDLVSELDATPGVAQATSPPLEEGATTGIITVIPETSPQSEETGDLIDVIRDDVVTAAEADSSIEVFVGGSTATFKDFASVLQGKLALFLVVIVLLGCLLLMLAFRSIVVPLTAALMNVLATAASFGVVVAIFQWGWGSELLGLGSAGPIETFLPVIMLAILFGLSMDYQVFLVSRMHEEWEASHDNTRAVAIGQAATGRVIVAASLIMICVFTAFVFGGERVIAMFGIGLAVAVLIDAFVIRTVLVPALMHEFGKWNWWLPGWLDRILPHLSVEGVPDSEAVIPAQRTGEAPVAGRHLATPAEDGTTEVPEKSGAAKP